MRASSSGLNLVDHSYLLDVGEEIDIQQVAENKLKVTDSVIVEPPYPKTRYFELVIREHNEGASSLVDDLQIYPVLVTKKPDRKFPGTTLQRDTLLITERIHTKTSTRRSSGSTAMISTCLPSSMQRIRLTRWLIGFWENLTKLSLQQKAVFVSHSSAGDRQILRAPFDAVSEEPHGTAVKTPEIPHRPEVQPVVQPRDTTRRPVILPGGQDEEISEDREGEIWVATPARSRRPAIQTGTEPKEIPGRTEFSPGFFLKRYLNAR